MTEKLNLPDFKGYVPRPPVLTMDEYLQFAEFFSKYILNRKAYQEEKKLSAVPVRFFLK